MSLDLMGSYAFCVVTPLDSNWPMPERTEQSELQLGNVSSVYPKSSPPITSIFAIARLRVLRGDALTSKKNFVDGSTLVTLPKSSSYMFVFWQDCEYHRLPNTLQ